MLLKNKTAGENNNAEETARKKVSCDWLLLNNRVFPPTFAVTASDSHDEEIKNVTDNTLFLMVVYLLYYSVPR